VQRVASSFQTRRGRGTKDLKSLKLWRLLACFIRNTTQKVFLLLSV
jgi:hypothetical protein